MTPAMPSVQRPPRDAGAPLHLAMLEGLIYCGHCHRVMQPTVLSCEPALYYACSPRRDAPYPRRLIASERIEHILTPYIRRAPGSQDVIAAALERADTQSIERLQRLEAVWEELPLVEQQRITRALVEGIWISTDG